MPFKSNPVLAIQMRRSALVAPHLLAQIHAAAGLAADERPDGAWHAEWEALRGLARHAVIASRCAAELAHDLEVDVEAAARNLAAHADQTTGVGRADEIVSRALESYGYEA
jgi:3-carboxy-cis,cis-muconate cycloisomerase